MKQNRRSAIQTLLLIGATLTLQITWNGTDLPPQQIIADLAPIQSEQNQTPPPVPEPVDPTAIHLETDTHYRLYLHLGDAEKLPKDNLSKAIYYLQKTIGIRPPH